MAANYNRPKPVDPISYRAGWTLVVSCRCGHRHSERLGAFAAARNLPMTLRLGEMVERLKCSRCNAKGVGVAFQDRRW